MKNVMSFLEPGLQAPHEAVQRAGKVVIGTVKGDIHEIGKSLVATLLSANGFEVHDLGGDAPNEVFAAKVRETAANPLGLSALLTTTMSVQRQVIEELYKAGLRDQVKSWLEGLQSAIIGPSRSVLTDMRRMQWRRAGLKPAKDLPDVPPAGWAAAFRKIGCVALPGGAESGSLSGPKP